MNKKTFITTLIVLQMTAISANATGNQAVLDNNANKTAKSTTSSKWSNVYSNMIEAGKISDRILNSGSENTEEPDDGEIIDINGAIVNKNPLVYSLSIHVDKQLAQGTNLVNKNASRSSELMTTYMMKQLSRSYVSADKSDLEYYLNPYNFTNTERGMMQFLTTNTYREVSVDRLNSYLNSKTSDVFKNKGQAFKDAAKKYNIDPVYFVAHSMWETGYGNSTLAKGQLLTTYKGEKLETPVMVYNFFGIGAVDGTANLSGAEAAYTNGWTTVDATIDGSAKWISENYPNSKYKQNSVYKMRWNYDVTWHQYATDVNWANGISGVMNGLINIYDPNAVLEFEIPQYCK